MNGDGWSVPGVALLGLLPPVVLAAATGAEPGPRVGEAVPAFSAPDQAGRVRTLGDLTGRNGLLLLFFRSADW